MSQTELPRNAILLGLKRGFFLKNKFNLIGSKEWLPYQKSWFRYQDESKFIQDTVRFFSLPGPSRPPVFYQGNSLDKFIDITKENSLIYSDSADQFQYALIDLRDQIQNITTVLEYDELRSNLFDLVNNLFAKLEDRRFITVVAQNKFLEGYYYPIAWDLSYVVSEIYSLKDEKIGCLEDGHSYPKLMDNQAGSSHFYVLNFRKDDLSKGIADHIIPRQFSLNAITKSDTRYPKWFILKPQRRNKEEILHPAKYPEDLIELFVNYFSNVNDNVYDPMSGTGSTQIGAMKLGRNGYGTELSEYFGNIAINRCQEFIRPTQVSLFEEKLQVISRIEISDAKNFAKFEFPKQHLLITSPPYWDMLNMKGAENQAKRIKSGLQTNYSDSEDDLGNINDYNLFVEKLADLYKQLSNILEDDARVVIVVKNIKKKGSNYPFAWDLSKMLQPNFVLAEESFWLQDDISIAPFGYGNTWVSNTFHQYCLTFIKKSN